MTRPNEITDAELSRLLSGRNELSVLEKELLREGIIHAQGTEPRSWFGLLLRPVTIGALSAAAAVAVGVFALRGALEGAGVGESGQRGGRGKEYAGLTDRPSVSPPDTYTARGAERAPALDLVCVGPRGSGPCARGRKLTFTVRGKGEWRHFAAFAQAADGTIYWYFPRPGASGIELDVTRPTLLDRAVVLGDEAGGPVTVYGVFSRVPLTRDGIKRAMGSNLKGDGTVSIVKRQLVIEERE